MVGLYVIPFTFVLIFVNKFNIINSLNKCYVGRCSSVGIATGYGLDVPAIESRLEARFSAPFQTGPGAHPALCTMDTGSFPGVESGQGVTLTPHSPSSTEV
jgi:hypothetical protein